VTCEGHSFECRINAEDPDSFLPSAGVVTHLVLPEGPGIRVDTHIHPGYKVSPYYDSLIAKLIVHGATREEALARARIALSEMEVEGISTNIPLHPAREKPFARAGDNVRSGDILALVRTGPVYAPIIAPRDGRVEQILAAAGDLVGFGSPLFRIR
jgi:acetyl/propionyl-CoA carboxylase alpha subunit